MNMRTAWLDSFLFRGIGPLVRFARFGRLPPSLAATVSIDDFRDGDPARVLAVSPNTDRNSEFDWILLRRANHRQGQKCRWEATVTEFDTVSLVHGVKSVG